jgi:ferrous iron transport protein B
VFDAGKIIIAIYIILWVMKDYAPSGRFEKIDKKYDSEFVKYQSDSTKIYELQLKKKSERLQNSYAGLLGKSIEPVIEPIGFDWKIGIALIASFAAREVFVSTMFSIYGFEVDETGRGEKQLSQTLKNSVNLNTGKKTYSLATIASLLVFYAFAMQCMSTLAVTYRETKSIYWTLFQFTFMTGLAYVSSFLVYQWLN